MMAPDTSEPVEMRQHVVGPALSCSNPQRRPAVYTASCGPIVYPRTWRVIDHLMFISSMLARLSRFALIILSTHHIYSIGAIMAPQLKRSRLQARCTSPASLILATLGVAALFLACVANSTFPTAHVLARYSPC